MKRLVLLGLLLAGCTQPPQQPPPGTPTPLTSTTSTPATPEGWHPFSAPDGSFSAILPGTVDVQEEEDGFEVLARMEPGPTVEIDVDRLATPKAAAKAHEEKVANARGKGGKVKSEKRDGNRVVLTLEDREKGQFYNVLHLSGPRVLDILVIGEEKDLERLLASLELHDTPVPGPPSPVSR